MSSALRGSFVELIIGIRGRERRSKAGRNAERTQEMAESLWEILGNVNEKEE